MKINFKKIIKVILWITGILFIILCLLLIFLAFVISKQFYVYKKPSEYNKCLETVFYKENIKHFPKTLPNNKRDIRLHCSPGEFEHDGALVLLKLKVDKEYIEKELNNHKFLNRKTPVGTVQKIYHMPSEVVDIKPENLTYYVLDEKENYNEGSNYFPYFTGIGIDKNYEYILYYYICPD